VLDRLKVEFGKEPFSVKQAAVALKGDMGYSANAV
jgi:hypothetical protein